MRTNLSHGSGLDFKRPTAVRAVLGTGVLDDFFEPFAGDWLYTIFDAPEPFEESVHESLRESWDAVGISMRDTIDRSDETLDPSLDVLKDRQIVRSR